MILYNETSLFFQIMRLNIKTHYFAEILLLYVRDKALVLDGHGVGQ